MKLIHKETGKLYKAKSGRILPEHKRKGIDGSFLTLVAEDDSKEELYYLYKYWADNEYELVEEQ